MDFEAYVFVHHQPPKHSGRFFATRLEAKQWCASNCQWEDDLYIILEKGLIIERHMIDGMWEDDQEYMASIS